MHEDYLPYSYQLRQIEVKKHSSSKLTILSVVNHHVNRILLNNPLKC